MTRCNGIFLERSYIAVSFLFLKTINLIIYFDKPNQQHVLIVQRVLSIKQAQERIIHYTMYKI